MFVKELRPLPASPHGATMASATASVEDSDWLDGLVTRQGVATGGPVQMGSGRWANW